MEDLTNIRQLVNDHRRLANEELTKLDRQIILLDDAQIKLREIQKSLE
jgi:hypothetical protein